VSLFFVAIKIILSYIFRYGGEEITVLIFETARKIVKKLRHMLETTSFDIEDGESISVTVSIGISSFPKDAKEVSILVSNADTALYKAKGSGRNCICVYEK
jgi:diguanylate cyclase (GGDEF)-like protein